MTRALLLALALLWADGAAAQPAPLVARLSTEQVSITTAFTGESLMIYGSTEDPIGPGGDEVLVVARGASGPFVVRRKVQVLGLWLNGPSARFSDVPVFYAISGTRPAWRLLPEEERQRRGLGLDAIPLRSTGARGLGFRAALLELKQSSRLWQEDLSAMEVAGSRLFSMRLELPSTVQPGTYRVEVLLVRSRRVVATEQLRFIVERTGSAARIAEVAREQPVLYALICIVLAAFSGWLGSVVFRRS